MTYELVLTGRFKKSLKLARKRGLDISKLEEVVEKLLHNIPLDVKHRDHELKGAWAWSGYLFILIAAVACIIFKIIGQEVLSFAASGAVCLMLLLYWISYVVLKRKY